MSAIWKRLMVVSRGEKKFSPMMSTVAPLWLIVASGLLLFAVPGSWSLAHCPRSSLKTVGVNELVREPAMVSVSTSESPVCSKAMFEPPLSKPTPVKSCRL